MELTIPQEFPAQLEPDTDQFTAVLEVPVTVAVNCSCPFRVTAAEVGEIETAVPPAVIVTEAEANLLLSAAEVAVTLTVGGVGIEEGAVYKPLEFTTPHVAPPQPGPDIDHVTAPFAVPFTLAVNCCVLSIGVLAEVGDTDTLTIEVVISTEADAYLVGSATDVAVTVTVGGEGNTDGAAYCPVEVNVPHKLPKQPTPDSDHATDLLEAPVTVARKDSLCLRGTVTDVGEIDTSTVEPAVTVSVVVP